MSNSTSSNNDDINTGVNVFAYYILFCAFLLSSISCSLVFASMFFDKTKSIQRSATMQLLRNLFISNISINILYILYYIFSNTETMKQEVICTWFYPLIRCFVLASCGWTIYIAFQFKITSDRQNLLLKQNSNSLSNPEPPKIFSAENVAIAQAANEIARIEYKKKIELLKNPNNQSEVQKNTHNKIISTSWTFKYGVWLLSFLLVLPIPLHNIIDIKNKSSDWNIDVNYTNGIIKGCVYHGSVTLFIIDIITFQIPVILTIFTDLYFYFVGIRSFVNAPGSVVARQMEKIGGFLLVLLITFIPNCIYNFIVIWEGLKDIQIISSKSEGRLFNAIIILQSLQGFFNFCVFIYTNQRMKKWLRRSLLNMYVTCFCLTSKQNRRSFRNSINRNSDSRNSGSISKMLKARSSLSRKNSLNQNLVNSPNEEGGLVENDKKKSILMTKSPIWKGPILEDEKFVRFGRDQVMIIPDHDGYSREASEASIQINEDEYFSDDNYSEESYEEDDEAYYDGYDYDDFSGLG